VTSRTYERALVFCVGESRAVVAARAGAAVAGGIDDIIRLFRKTHRTVAVLSVCPPVNQPRRQRQNAAADDRSSGAGDSDGVSISFSVCGGFQIGRRPQNGACVSRMAPDVHGTRSFVHQTSPMSAARGIELRDDCRCCRRRRRRRRCRCTSVGAKIYKSNAGFGDESDVRDPWR
jgi:hypothetical protein